MQTKAAKSFRKWGYSWLALVAAFAIHVLDEAVNEFLPLYNSIVTGLRDSFRFVPFPTFTFGVWLGGLLAAIVILAMLTPLAFSGRSYFRIVSYVFSIIMILNGLGHIAASLYWGHLVPGVLSSPLLLVAGMVLLISTPSTRRIAGAGGL